MSGPAVSVVIVTYNKEDTLSAAIDSVLRQTYQDFEVIVVDDGSTDDTPRKAAAYGARIRYIRKENGGTGSARNRGIAESKGNYVAFLDGDDLWLPRKLERQVEAFRREPQILAVQCGAYLVDQNLKAFEVRHCHPRRDTLENFLRFRNLPGFSSAVMVRREAFDKVGGFGTDLVILSDWDMACRLARAGTLRSVPELLVLYRHYPKNQSRDVGIHVEPGIRSLERFFASEGLDPKIRSSRGSVHAHFYAMLAGGYLRNRQWGQAVAWAWKAIRTSPQVLPYVSGLPLRLASRLLRPLPQPSEIG